MDYTRISARYSILYKYNGFNIMGRKDILPTKGFVSKVLSFTSLFLTESSRNRSIKRTVDVISISGNAFIKSALVRI